MSTDCDFSDVPREFLLMLDSGLEIKIITKIGCRFKCPLKYEIHLFPSVCLMKKKQPMTHLPYPKVLPMKFKDLINLLLMFGKIRLIVIKILECLGPNTVLYKNTT